MGGGGAKAPGPQAGGSYLDTSNIA